MTTPRKTNRRALTHREARLVWETLLLHCTKTEDGAVFEDGWDDRRVANVTGALHNFPVVDHQVARVRREEFGDLARLVNRRAGPKGPALVLLAELEAKFVGLEAQVEALQTAVNRLNARHPLAQFPYNNRPADPSPQPPLPTL